MINLHFAWSNKYHQQSDILCYHVKNGPKNWYLVARATKTTVITLALPTLFAITPIEMRQRTADISVIFVRAAQSDVTECVCTRQPTRIMKFRYRKTILSCMPGQILLRPLGESYTPNNCYRGKLHVPCIPLRNSAVTLLSPLVTVCI